MKTKNQKPLPKKAKSNPATSTSEEASDKLQLAFLSTDLMQDWMEFNDALEAAIKTGKDRAELPLAFLKRVQYEISGTPHRFDAVTEEWNRVCDQQGRPEEKKNTPGPEEGGAGEEGTDGPF